MKLQLLRKHFLELENTYKNQQNRLNNPIGKTKIDFYLAQIVEVDNDYKKYDRL